MAYEILPPEDEGGRYEILPPEPTKRRTLAEEFKRQAGLTVRYGAEGLASLPGIFIDPFQRLAGAKTMSQATSDVLTRLGLPKPETGAEEISGAISKAVAGTGPLTRAAAAIPEGLAQLAPKYFRGGEGVRNILAEKPLAQIAQAGIGGGAAEITKQAGGGELAQLVASAMAPLGVSSAADITSRVARGGRELVRPVTQGGAKQVAADVLGQVVSDKTRAIQNLERYEALRERGAIGVPGSKPTAGAVSADYGLIGGEQLAARGPSNPEFAARYATSNEARLAHLAKLRATNEQLAIYEARREAVTAPLRDQAFANAEIGRTAGYDVAGAVNFQPVVERVIRLTATPEGGRAESQRALQWITQRIGNYLREGRIDPRNAYELHKDIGDLVKGKIADEKGSIRLAAGLANDVKKTLGAEINRAAPGFNKYLETYSRLSKPIDRLEVITEKLGGEALARVTNATPLVGPGGPQFGLSQAKMRQQVGNIENALPVSPQGLPLAPYQRDVLGRVMGDLNSEALAARGGKMPGSDTYQNMATANLLSSIFGKTLGEAGVPKLVSGPFNFAYRPLEQRIRNIVDEAYLDPKKMAELLKIARTKRNTPTLGDLLTSAEQNIYGGLLGGAVSQ